MHWYICTYHKNVLRSLTVSPQDTDSGLECFGSSNWKGPDECNIKGPFESKEKAQNQLDRYLEDDFVRSHEIETLEQD